MALTVKDNGVRVANPSYKGSRISGDQIKQNHPTLLDELGFKRVGDFFWVSSLCVVWKDDPYTLSIQRGDFVKSLRIEESYDLYEFVSDFLQTVRDVWVGGCEV